MLIIDEVYVKSILQYHAGIAFGKTVNKPSKLAYTVLSFMFVDLAVLIVMQNASCKRVGCNALI